MRHVPFSNFLNLPEGQKNTGLQGETELPQETGLWGWMLPFIRFLTQAQGNRPLFLPAQWHSRVPAWCRDSILESTESIKNTS